MLQLRAAGPDDAAAWTRVVLAASPHFVIDEASARHELQSRATTTAAVLVEKDGVAVGVARWHHRATTSGSATASTAMLSLMVDPGHRRRGIGTTLLRAVLDRLPPGTRVDAVVEDDPASDAARAAWGFTVTRRFRQWSLDPRQAPAPGPTPVGYRLTTTQALGPEVVWRGHQQVAADDPSGITRPTPYDDWLEEWQDPRARHDASWAVVDESGGLASWTLLGVAGDRGWSNMTGTLPTHRGRGLALLCKQHSLAAAARLGVRRCFTGNDSANTAMLAVNARLGYQLAAQPCLASKETA